jgi:hypothetical protein
VFPKHERWLRGFECCVPGCDTGLKIEAHHLRSAANSGTSLKPASWFCIALCASHHDQYHKVGIDTFAEMHKLDLWAMAEEFASRSPDMAMREAMREAAE